MTGPFEGLCVVDLSDRLGGAFAARLFGDFGADVILAEPPTGHALRHEPPFLDDEPGLERSVLHAFVNWNKRSVVIHDAAQLGDIVAGADVVVTTGLREGRLPIREGLARLRPDAVHLSVTPHGLSGPLAGRPGNNLTTSARTGWAYINRYLDEPPLQMPLHQAGYVGGIAGFVAGAAALRRRTQRAEAELVDVREVEAFALTVHPWGVAAVYEDTGFSNGPAGGRRRGEPGPLWDAADGRLHFGLADFRNWPAAMEVLGLPELAHEPDLVADIGRHSRDLSAAVAGIARTLVTLHRWEVFHALARLRCPVGVVQDVEDILRDPQLTARAFLVETTLDGRRVRAPGSPARMERPLWQPSRPAPRLDEHGHDVQAPVAPRPPLAPPPGRGAAGEEPLRGVRVLSFGQAWSGAFATELLALLGADVVQIGSLHRPDVWRRVRGRVPRAVSDAARRQHPLNTQGLYNSVNLNKREITLDMGQVRGREIFWKLVPRFDVLIDNFRPTVLPAWGITLEALHRARPGIVWASISAYGATGPYREYAGNGATTEPMSGFSSIHGYEGDHGMNSGGLYPDPVAGYFLAACVLAALRERDRIAEPQRIDLSMVEAMVTVCGDAVVAYDATGRLPRPAGNHHPRIAPHNVYAARDGQWLALAAETEEAWQALVAHIGDERLRDGRFVTMASRKAHEAELDAILGEWCAAQDAAYAEDVLGRLAVAAARVVPLYEIYSRPDPNFVACGFLSLVDHPETGPTWLPGRPWRFSAPSGPIRPSPGLGQHSREVLAEELGIGDEEYQSLVAAGVTGSIYELPVTME